MEGAPTAPLPRSLQASPGRALVLPLLFTAGLLAVGLCPPVRQAPRVFWSFLVAASILLAWNGALLLVVLRTRRVLTLAIALRKQHYVQACAHTAILLYWGWYFRPVYESAHLIVAQLCFAYAFDMLLSWSRRDSYTLGFGPCPIVLSTNLFLWFKPDWFFLQFLMVAVGFAAKEFIRWHKDGRQAHIFNPSSFALTVMSLALILTGASDITWGRDIAITQFYPPHMYLFLFLIALPGQFLFGVTTMTLSAVLTTYVCGLAYYAATGTYYFFDSHVPIAVFLGMHLLFTDPSTSPRSELGRLIAGALYGASSMLLYGWLGHQGVPAFYDKLLQVPMLNLSVRWIDRVARSPRLRAVDPSRIGRSLAPRQRHLGYMTIWAGVFVALSMVDGLGDRHRGQWLPFWEGACRAGHPRACEHAANLQQILCDAGSGWACNEVGLRTIAEDRSGGAARGAAAQAADSFERGCRLGCLPACRNVRRGVGDADPLERAQPTLADYPILVRGSKGPVTDRTPAGLYAKACEQGWPDTCGRVGLSR